jgi:dCTP deaminase
MAILLREHLADAMRRPVLQERLIVIPLLDAEQVSFGSIDLRLGTEFLEVQRRREAALNPLDETASQLAAVNHESVFVPLGEHVVLHPGQFILGATLEFLRLPADIAGQVVGRSSWGRVGLVVATAVAVQPGFTGSLTLELVNTGSVPIFLYPGLRVAQLQLWAAAGPTELEYGAAGGKYRAPLGPQSNRLAWEHDELAKLKRIGKRMSGEG